MWNCGLTSPCCTRALTRCNVEFAPGNRIFGLSSPIPLQKGSLEVKARVSESISNCYMPSFPLTASPGLVLLNDSARAHKLLTLPGWMKDNRQQTSHDQNLWMGKLVNARDLTPFYVPHAIGELTSSSVVHCWSEAVGVAEAMHNAANSAGVL